MSSICLASTEGIKIRARLSYASPTAETLTYTVDLPHMFVVTKHVIMQKISSNVLYPALTNSITLLQLKIKSNTFTLISNMNGILLL